MTSDLSVRPAVAYMPQLDALRAFAVGAVLVHHGLDGRLIPSMFSSLKGGDYGVKLFFVLSGFLITGILLRARPSPHGQSPWHTVRQFYVRRFLRIFPLYYFAIALLFLMNITPVREEIWWLLTYTSNFRMAWLGWYFLNVGHFWSLAVEEQFYLFWPWVVLFAPVRWLILAAITMVLLGPVYRLIALQLEMNEVAYYAVTFSSFDALGVGALLAIASRGAPASGDLRRMLTLWILPPALVAAALINIFAPRVQIAAFLDSVVFDTALALIFGWLVAVASSGVGGMTGHIFEWKPIQYCGRIAYGIYVYHELLAVPIYDTGVWLGLSWQHGSYLNFAVTTISTIAVASLSWHLMEHPINALKTRFSYDTFSLKPETKAAERGIV